MTPIWTMNPFIYDSEDEPPAVATTILVGGGFNTAAINNIQSFSADTFTTTAAYGTLTLARLWLGSVSSSTRAIWWCGQTGDSVGRNTMDFIEIAVGGTAESFGTNAVILWGGTACSNATRGLHSGGTPGVASDRTNAIYTILIATKANSTSYGAIGAKLSNHSSTGSQTRALYSGGNTDTNAYTNRIYYSEFSTSSTAAMYGDLIEQMRLQGKCNDGVTALVMGGSDNTATRRDVIWQMTIATLMNAATWGTLRIANNFIPCNAASSKTRAFVCGGLPAAGVTDEIQKVDFATAGTATTWGTLNATTRNSGACSSNHGGL